MVKKSASSKFVGVFVFVDRFVQAGFFGKSSLTDKGDEQMFQGAVRFPDFRVGNFLTASAQLFSSCRISDQFVPIYFSYKFLKAGAIQVGA